MAKKKTAKKPAKPKNGGGFGIGKNKKLNAAIDIEKVSVNKDTSKGPDGPTMSMYHLKIVANGKRLTRQLMTKDEAIEVVQRIAEKDILLLSHPWIKKKSFLRNLYNNL